LSGQEFVFVFPLSLTTTRTAAMIRLLTTFVLIGLAAADCTVSNTNFFCDAKDESVEFPSEVCSESTCTTAIKKHIKEEFKASFLYLHMGAMFAQDTVARPGIAKFMLESATEERSHANLMMDYLNKRGIQLTDKDLEFVFNNGNITEALGDFMTKNATKKEELLTSMTMQEALKMALKMEISVTKLIIGVVEKCECDYHAADVFTNPILDEQHDGIRKLQGVIREFEDLMNGHKDSVQQGGMVDFIMDQKILKGGL